MVFVHEVQMRSNLLVPEVASEAARIQKLGLKSIL